MKTNYTLNEILDEMKQEEKTTFGNLEERVRTKYPHYNDAQISYETRWLARTQILHIIGSTYTFFKISKRSLFFLLHFSKDFLECEIGFHTFTFCFKITIS
jgi:hypothetical protein